MNNWTTMKLFFFYQYYIRGEVTQVDELDSKMASLTMFKNIASEKCVSEMIKELLVSRELKFYIVDSVRKEKEL